MGEKPPSTSRPPGAQTELERYRRIFATTRCPLALLTLSPLRFIQVNEAFCSTYRYSQAEALALDPARIARDTGEVAAMLGELQEGPPLARPLRWHQRSDGSLLPVETQALALQLDEGPGACLWLRDLSELRALHEKVNVADRLSLLGSLAGGLSHEISGSVGVVAANLGFAAERLRGMQQRSDSIELRELGAALAESGDAAERLRQLAFDLKIFARLDKPGKAPVELRPLLESVLHLVNSELRHRTQLEVRLSGAPAVSGAEGLLGQTFLHLLLHAVSALPPQKASQNQIRLRAFRQEQQAVVEVELSGSPVAPADRQLIFDPLFARDRSGQSSSLPVCSALVEQLGGTLTLSEGEGGRSLFRITLPAAQGESRRTVSEPRLQALQALPRILVVDEEPLLCDTVRRMLLGEAEAVALTDSEEALRRLLDRERFDAVLCNIAMPRKSGIELFASLQRDRPELLPRLGFISNVGLGMEAQQFVRAHHDRVLEKPFGREGLRGLLRTLLGG